MAKNNDAWKRFVDLYCGNEDFRKAFDAIEIPEDAPTPNVEVPKKDLERMYKASGLN